MFEFQTGSLQLLLATEEITPKSYTVDSYWRWHFQEKQKTSPNNESVLHNSLEDSSDTLDQDINTSSEIHLSDNNQIRTRGDQLSIPPLRETGLGDPS